MDFRVWKNTVLMQLAQEVVLDLSLEVLDKLGFELFRCTSRETGLLLVSFHEGAIEVVELLLEVPGVATVDFFLMNEFLQDILILVLDHLE